MKKNRECVKFTNEELAILAQAGNKEAEEILVKRNMRLVGHIAKVYAQYESAYDYEDLVNEGAIGLIQSINHFDPARGTKFVTCAGNYIKGALGNAVRGAAEGKCFRIGREQKKIYRQIVATSERLQQELLREPTSQEVADRMGMDIVEMEYIFNLNRNHESINKIIFNGEKANGGDITLEDSVEKSLSPTTDQIIDSIILKEAMSHLSERRQFVLTKIYWEGYSQEEVAEMLGTSQCNVSRDKLNAEKQLKDIIQNQFNKPKDKRRYDNRKEYTKTKVRCINTGEIYNSLREAERMTGVGHSNLCKHLMGQRKYCGQDPVTGEKWVWERISNDENPFENMPASRIQEKVALYIKNGRIVKNRYGAIGISVEQLGEEAYQEIFTKNTVAIEVNNKVSVYDKSKKVL